MQDCILYAQCLTVTVSYSDSDMYLTVTCAIYICNEQGLLFQIKDVVHRAREGQLQGGAWNIAIMWGPPPVHATPQLGHD